MFIRTCGFKSHTPHQRPRELMLPGPFEKIGEKGGAGNGAAVRRLGAMAAMTVPGGREIEMFRVTGQKGGQNG